MRNVQLFFVCAFSFSSGAMALDSGRVGNGGDAVICRPSYLIPGMADYPGSVHATLLDYYEWTTLHAERYMPAFTGPDTTENFVMQAVARLARFDAKRAAAYVETAKMILRREPGNVLYLPGIDLTDIPDSFHIAIPHGCRIQQAAVHGEPGFPDFTFSQDIWDLMDSTQQAGLIIHEVIYADLHSRGQPNSIMARKLTAVLSSNALDGIDGAALWGRLRWETAWDGIRWLDEQTNRIWTLVSFLPMTETDAKNACAALIDPSHVPSFPEFRPAVQRIWSTSMGEELSTHQIRYVWRRIVGEEFGDQAVSPKLDIGKGQPVQVVHEGVDQTYTLCVTP